MSERSFGAAPLRSTLSSSLRRARKKREKGCTASSERPRNHKFDYASKYRGAKNVLVANTKYREEKKKREKKERKEIKRAIKVVEKNHRPEHGATEKQTSERGAYREQEEDAAW